MGTAEAMARFVLPLLQTFARMDVQDEAGGGSTSIGTGERGKCRDCFSCLWSHRLVPAVTRAAAGKPKDPFKGLGTTLLL